ncbi:MAG: D-alanyl-D-alanine carboxypeptidase [Lachnospiraceae bacterium]|nr:D-alanyl-D-alanine carboxypeptidase [Lachnospiraceae bacterium]
MLRFHYLHNQTGGLFRNQAGEGSRPAGFRRLLTVAVLISALMLSGLSARSASVTHPIFSSTTGIDSCDVLTANSGKALLSFDSLTAGIGGTSPVGTLAADTDGTLSPSDTLAAAAAADADLGLTCKSAILMEASTGTVLFAQDADVTLSPASITKIMTLILIFDAIADGSISLDDTVTTSAYAKSMGGSQVFLEEGEQQTVETMIKCIVVASGNDASVAMAEHIAGSETEFVRRMNERAAELGMTNTHFEDCCGLTDSENHYTTARDVAVMSRELITKYPQISDYSTIWMENITHATSQGSREFTLTNTNKLLKMSTSYEVLGLKTGSTSVAKYCVSAVGQSGGLKLIAVVMAAADYKVRFSEADTLLKFGFANCSIYTDAMEETLPDLPVTGGTEPTVSVTYGEEFSCVGTEGENFANVTKEIRLAEKLTAPVKAGDVVGTVTYSLDGTELGSVNLIAAADVERAGYLNYIFRVIRRLAS